MSQKFIPPPPSEEAKLIDSLEEARPLREREGKRKAPSARRGWGKPYDDIDGHKTDERGRPIPNTRDRSEILRRRKDRKCPAPGCDKPPSKDQFACMSHWYMLPASTRTRMWQYSNWTPDMGKLKSVVKDALVWYDLALGPALTPEKIAERVVDLLPDSWAFDGDDLIGDDIRLAVIKAVEEGVCVTRKEKGSLFDEVWQDRLDCVWR